MDILNKEDIKSVIGEFYPARPILTNDQIYRKILDINPEFSIVNLLKRYEDWFDNKIEEGELYSKLSGLEFSATGSQDNYIQLNSRNNLKELEELLDVKPVVEGSNTLFVEIDHPKYNQLLDSLKQYINNDISHPASNRILYNNLYELEFVYSQEELGEGYVDNIDEYVNKIKQYDRSFGLSELYYRIHSQYIIAKKLDQEYVNKISSILPKLNLIYYYDDENLIGFYNNDRLLLEMKDANNELFNMVVANLYHGINSSETSYKKDNIIEVDTYPNVIMF